MKPNIFIRLTTLLFLYFLFSFGFILSRGFYSFKGSLLILMVICLLLLFLTKNKIFSIKVSKKQFIRLLELGLCLNLILTWWIYGGLYQQSNWALKTSYLLLELLGPISLFCFFRFSLRYIKWLTILLATVWLSLQLLMVFSSPRPWIDVYEMLKDAPLALVKGENPYSINYKQMYFQVEPNFFSYLPFMFLYTAPFVFLFGEPRWAFIGAQFLTFFLLVRKPIGKDKIFGRQFTSLLGLLVLFQPLSLYITEQSYTEPLVLLEITALYYFIINKNEKLSAIILGIALATKQYLIFLLPFLFKGKLLKKNAFLLSLLFFFGFIGPFLVWNLKDFIHDAVLLQHFFPPRYEGLSFSSFLFHNFGLTHSNYLALFIWLVLGFFIYRTKRGKGFNFIFEYTLFLLIFFFFNKWSFVNYYYLVANLFLLSLYAIFYQSECAGRINYETKS